MTPSGTISFVSKGYGGCASDRYITETCAVLEKVKPGDTLMADKGFNISDLLVGKGTKLVIPAPSLKIHVERAIARIKAGFSNSSRCYPSDYEGHLLDDMFIIIAAITNLAPPLVSLEIFLNLL